VKPFPLGAAAVLLAYLVTRRRKLERLALGAGLVVAAGLVVYGLGVIHPPSLEHVLLTVGERLGKLTYLLVGGLAFLETGAFIGLVAPGETAVLLGGVVAGQGEIDVVTLIAIVWACAVAGDLTSFALGHKLGRAWLERHGERVKITPERLEKVEAFFDRHGGKAILVGRFVGLVRSIAPFLAGSARMPLRRFVPYDVIGAGLWGSTFVLLGYLFWHSLHQVLELAKRGALALTTVIVLVAGIVVAARWLREPGNRDRARAWLAEHADRPPVRWVATPLARVAEPLVRRAERPARFVWDRVTPGDLGLELTTLLAIALVGAFVFGGYAAILTHLSFTVGDSRALLIADDLRSAPLVDAARAATWLGALPVAGGALALVAAFLLVRRWWLEAATLIAGMGLTVAAVQIAKAAEGRPRPTGALVATSYDSYPSGHGAYAVAWVAIAVALGRTLPGLGRRAAAVSVAITVVVLVGLTRIYLRAHYLSDVLGGAGLAASLFACCGLVALIVAHVRQNDADRHDQ
jgi:undecaprenyl-diphosphatase